MEKINKIKPIIADIIAKYIADDGYFDIKTDKSDGFYQSITATKNFLSHDEKIDSDKLPFIIHVMNDIEGITIYLTVHCLLPVTKEHFVFGLKLLNMLNCEKKGAKYYILNGKYLSYATFHSIVNPEKQLINGVANNIECSVKNVIMALSAIIHRNVNYVDVDFQKVKKYLN
jgi:hypothetical protein